MSIGRIAGYSERIAVERSDKGGFVERVGNLCVVVIHISTDRSCVIGRSVPVPDERSAEHGRTIVPRIVYEHAQLAVNQQRGLDTNPNGVSILCTCRCHSNRLPSEREPACNCSCPEIEFLVNIRQITLRHVEDLPRRTGTPAPPVPDQHGWDLR